jgi:hypothetical protein
VHWPLSAAFGDSGFWAKDEIYQIDGPYDRARVHVLRSPDMTRPENARKPELLVRDDDDFAIARSRLEGTGPVLYTLLGHNPALYRTHKFLSIILTRFSLLSAILPPTPRPAHG